MNRLPPIVQDFLQKARSGDNEYIGRVKEIAEECAKVLSLTLSKPDRGPRTIIEVRDPKGVGKFFKNDTSADRYIAKFFKEHPDLKQKPFGYFSKIDHEVR